MFIEGDDHTLYLTSLEFNRLDRKQDINVGCFGQLSDQPQRPSRRVVAASVPRCFCRQFAILSAGLPMKFAQRLSPGKESI